MAKIETIDIIKSASGKLFKNSGFYLYTNKLSGKQSVRKIGNDPNKPRSEKQLEQQRKLMELNRCVHEWFEANKPSASHPEGSPRYQEVVKAFKNQHEIGTINNFVRKILKEESSKFK